MWTGDDTLPVDWAVPAIALSVVLVASAKVRAFLALTIGALSMGLAAFACVMGSSVVV